MSQEVENIKSGYPLFRGQEYRESLDNKKALYEDAHDANRIKEVFEWTTSQEYKELNFEREALTINPAKACQPLGAVSSPGLREDAALRPRLSGLRRLLPDLLQPPLQGADLLRLRLDDGRRGGLRRPEEHVRRAGERHKRSTSRR